MRSEKFALIRVIREIRGEVFSGMRGVGKSLTEQGEIRAS
jgi:hypothetical protein